MTTPLPILHPDSVPFLCTRFQCKLTPAACIARQDARYRASRSRGVTTFHESALYPMCARGCGQGEGVRAAVEWLANEAKVRG